MKNGKIMALSKSKEMCSFKTDYEKKSVEVQVTGFAGSTFIARLLAVERRKSFFHSDKKLLQCSVQR